MGIKVRSREDLNGALLDVDEILQTRLNDVLYEARNIDALLDEVLVFPLDPMEFDGDQLDFDPSTMFYSGGSSLITFGTDLNAYKSLLDGPYEGRFKDHKSHIEEIVGHVSTGHIVEISLAHELGHALDFLKL